MAQWYWTLVKETHRRTELDSAEILFWYEDEIVFIHSSATAVYRSVLGIAHEWGKHPQLMPYINVSAFHINVGGTNIEYGLELTSFVYNAHSGLTPIWQSARHVCWWKERSSLGRLSIRKTHEYEIHERSGDVSGMSIIISIIGALGVSAMLHTCI